MADFAKGIKVTTLKFDNGGEIIKLGINIEKLKDNPLNGDWLNVDLKKSKEKQEWYAVIDDYKKG